METGPSAEVLLARVTSLDGCEALREAARAEGFEFLDRMAAEWLDGTNRFDSADEVLFGAFGGGDLVGTAGVTRQGPTLGRVRRVYVHPEWRRRGIAMRLMNLILEFASGPYTTLVLYAEREEAFLLYNRLGFVGESPDGPDHATHRLDLGQRLSHIGMEVPR